MIDFTKLIEAKENQRATAASDAKYENQLAVTAKVSDTILLSTEALIKYLQGATTKAEVINQITSVHTPDVEAVVKALNILDDTVKSRENVDLTEVTRLMKGILDEAKSIPKSLPNIPEAKVIDNTKQFAQLVKAIEAVGEIVKAQKLIAEAPVVNVPQAEVNIDAPDLKPLQKGFKDVVRAVSNIAIPEAADNSQIEKLLKSSNKLLKELLEKPVSGGGGGGGGWIAVGTNDAPQPLKVDASGNLLVSGGSSGGAAKATDAYGIQAISDDGTYKYFFFEDATGAWYVMRKNKTTSVFDYTKGTGGYATVYQSAILGPSGGPTYASYGVTF